MKNILIVFVATFCINTLAWSQEELKYFENDNTFYLGNYRLTDSEIWQTLRSNPSALESWEKGNLVKENNKSLKIATGVLLISGGIITLVSIAFIPLILLGAEDVGTWITAGLILCGAGIITAILIPVTKTKYQSCYSNAVNIYNKGLSKTTVSLHIGAVGNGLGFSLKF